MKASAAQPWHLESVNERVGVWPQPSKKGRKISKKSSWQTRYNMKDSHS